jgi:hypothetical protein
VGTAVDEDLTPDAGAEIKAPVAKDEDELAFLKPGYRRPKAAPVAEDLTPDADADVVNPAGPEDRIGRAAREYQENTAALASARQGGDKVAPYGLSGIVTDQQTQLPDISGKEAFARGAVQGVTLGWGDEIAGAAYGLLNTIENHELLDRDARRREYETARDEIRAKNAAAQAAHPTKYGAGRITGGLVSALIPGTSVARGAGALEVGAQGAVLGGIAGAGESNATNAKDVLGEAAESAALGGAGGAALHTVGTKVVAPLAQKAIGAIAEKLPALADRQAVKQLSRDVPMSLDNPMTGDKNLSAAINEPIDIGAKKPITLAAIAGKPATEVRSVVNAGHAKIESGLENLANKSDVASSGGEDLRDVANRYDTEIENSGPLSKKQVNELEKARQEALEHFGPSEDQIKAKHQELGQQTDKIYDKSDQKTGGVTVGDLQQHRLDQIAELEKSPGNEDAIAALDKARRDEMKWGNKTVMTPDPKTDADIAHLMSVRGDPDTDLATVKQIDQRIAEMNAARKSSVVYDPTVKVPSKVVRAYATKLQTEGATNIPDPKLAAKARQLLGASTKDFVNGHVESALGTADRKTLEGLNGRTSNLYKWPDVVSGKETDPAVRNSLLNEFSSKVPTKALNDFAEKLEAQGGDNIAKLSSNELTKARTFAGETARDIATKHAERTLSPEDLAEYSRLTAHKASLKNIDAVLERRGNKEVQGKIGLRDALAHATGTGVGIHQVSQAIPRAMSGDIAGAAGHLGAGLLATATPFAIKNANAIGRGLVRGAAQGADLLANVVARAEAGNPWASRMVATLRQTPGGAARLAAAMARMKSGGGAGAGAPPEAP